MVEKNELEAMLSMGRKSLIDYSILLQKDYAPNWHHELIAEKLERVAANQCNRLMIFMPPRHGKSELASIKFPAWYLGRHPEKRIMACSYSAELAEEFGRNTRATVENELHTSMFSDSVLQVGSKSACNWKVSQRGGYVGTGVGGSIGGKGADVLIIDDPIKNREEAESETVRRKVYDWYTSTAYTRLEKRGAVIVILTRWHDDDLAGRILEREGEKGYHWDKKSASWKKNALGNSHESKYGKWEVVRFPAIATEDEDYRFKGEALWEQKYNLDALEEIKDTVGVRDWGSLYQQDPVTEEGAEFKEEWFKYWTKLPKNLKYVTTVDLAISQKRTADDSVVMTTAIDSSDNIYVVEYKNWKATPSEVIQEIYRQNEEYDSSVAVESVGYQKALFHYIQLEGRKRGKYLHIEPINTQTKKEEKIRALQPYYSNGLLYHANGMQELEDQLKRFPSGRHDDIIDALAMSLDLLRRPRPLREIQQDTNSLLNIKYTVDGLPYL
jgi:predicted phage terminase large subunit-like protein